MNDISMHAITRQQPTSDTGHWQVDFTRRHQRYAHRFHDSIYGSSGAALRAAVAWRDGTLAYIEALGVAEVYKAKHSGNPSSVEGVHFRRSSRWPAGIWMAELKLANGSLLRKSFHVSAYGRDKAFELAAAARKEMQRVAEAMLAPLIRPARQAAVTPSAGPAGACDVAPPVWEHVKALYQARSGPRKPPDDTRGVRGVKFITPKNQVAGVWQASLFLRDGRQLTRQFSVRMHGHDKAFELAAGARQVMLLRQAELQLYSCGSGSAP